MKTKFILSLIFMSLISPFYSFANIPDIQNILWSNDYSITFDIVENAASYKYNFSINNSKKPNELFTINSFEEKNGTIKFFPKEALDSYKNNKTSVYRVWIIALDKNNNELTSLTQGNGGKIIPNSTITSILSTPPPTNEEIPITEEKDTPNTGIIKPEISEKQEETSNTNSSSVSETKEIEPTDDWKNPFEDVSENTWYYEAIKFSNKNNLLNGLTHSQFGPQTPMTRGMLACVLYRHSQDTLSTESTITFSDVKKSSYYSKAISWMCENNISYGVGKNQFKPNDPITREQLITILYNYHLYLGNDINSNAADFSIFNDSEEINSWAKVPLCWAIDNNLIGGRTEATLAPREATTRAEVATILMRFLAL